MTEGTTPVLAPVARNERIDVLDMLRGIAILGIFFMNIPFMAAELSKIFVAPQLIGWSPTDAALWMTVQVLLEGTQRGLLELLFGAGMMVLTRHAMTPDGPVGVADLFFRRNWWLLFFGLVDIFVLGWAGDILHVYAIAALLLFPFRKMKPRWLLVLGLGFALFIGVTGGIRYAERVDLLHRAEAAIAKQDSGAKLNKAETKTIEDWKKAVESRKGNSPEFKEIREQEKKGHESALGYIMFNIGSYIFFVFESLPMSVGEAFCTMLIGIAFWKWGIIQGQRSSRFYWGLMALCYAFAFPLRYAAGLEHQVLAPEPRSFWITQEIARIAVSVGHVALINLMVRGRIGAMVLAPFKAAGRTAFSLYFMQQIIGIWILFAPWGPGLWSKLSWTQMYAVALAMVAAQLVIANLWVKLFAMGPLEWAWRSLSYMKRQPFLKRPETP